MTQQRLLYGVLLLFVVWMLVSAIALFGLFFPIFWSLPVLIAAHNWHDDEDEVRKPRKRPSDHDWTGRSTLRRETEYLETADGERLPIIDDDGSTKLHLLAS